ncbi:hypothetical protein ACH36K_12160 [Clostridium sp. MB05]|uniref:hypothetical protein n=1 Tax=Clostridium sp. MB05 TaxID=3376682 RepID=UPI003982879D
MRRVLIFSLLLFSLLFYGCDKEEIKKLPMEESIKKVYEQYNPEEKYDVGDKVEVKGKIKEIKTNNNSTYFYEIESSIYGYDVIVQLKNNIITEDAEIGDYITLNCMIDSFNNSTFPDAEAIVYYENTSQSKSNEPKPSEVIVQEKLTLEESKEELANIKDSITNGEGKVEYISGRIESELIPITIKMNDGKGEIKDITIDVYEMKFVTRNNTSHRVYISIENIGSKHTYQKGDSIYYDIKKDSILNQAWYIGENKEVLYLILIE